MAIFKARLHSPSGLIYWSVHLILSLVVLLISMDLNARTPSDESDLTHIQLDVGQSVYLNGPDSEDLLVSRKGLVDLYFTKDRKWRVTGLKPGFLSIRASGRQWMITVEKNKKTQVMTGKDIPDWICRLPGITCHQKARILSGVFGHRYEFIQAQDWCLSNKPCLFTGFLEEGEQKKLKAELSKHLPDHSVMTITAGQMIGVETDCSPGADKHNQIPKTIQSPLIRSLLTRNLIQLRCRTAGPGTMWTIKSKIFLSGHQKVIAKGFQFSSEPGFELGARLSPTGRILTRLNNLTTKNQARVIAEPLIITRAGVKNKITSGGEFPALKPRRPPEKNTRMYWKEYGVSLETQVLSAGDGFVILDYQMSLKQPSQTQKGHLNAQLLNSQLTIPLNTPVLAGQVSLNHKNHGNEHSPIFSKVPLIGPLFQNSSEQKDDSTLYVWFEISKHRERTNHQAIENFSDSFLNTSGGTSPETLPPSAATSLTILDEI